MNSVAATASARPLTTSGKQKFGGLEVSDAKRLRLVEDENRKLKKLVADQALDNMVLKDLLAKKS
jgi:putative transposase